VVRESVWRGKVRTIKNSILENNSLIMTEKKETSNFKSIKEYFSDSRLFVVPYYQRGYKWSLQKNAKRGDLHLNLLLQDLISEFKNAVRKGIIVKNYEYYLQGITVKETDLSIELVDGQQRTTSLFIILCVLKNLGADVSIELDNKLKYDVREAANDVLQQFISGTVEGDENIQDIAALKEAWKLCYSQLKKVDNLALFTEFLLNHIKVIYIKLDNLQDEAKVFSMMNKDKAEMTQTDLIKSNILREASRQLYNDNQAHDGLEWQINQLRTKLATEWDNWRKWWENKDHVEFCRMISIQYSKAEEPDLSKLLELFKKSQEINIDDNKKVNLFEYFKSIVADKEAVVIEAIEVFDAVKLIQNILQEWYQDVKIYNYLGLLFKGCGLEHKEDVLLQLIKDYIQERENFSGKVKSLYVENILETSSPKMLVDTIVNHNDAYHNMYTIVSRQLLRMNVERTSYKKQKFDFSLYEENSYNSEEVDVATKRSVEHIKPQKYIHHSLNPQDLEDLNKLTNTIGNLVLIPRGLNSILSNKSFDDKKKEVFRELTDSKENKYGLWLHTLSVFGSKSDWLKKEIDDNKNLFINEAKAFYNYK